jgi:hypothetical protein
VAVECGSPCGGQSRPPREPAPALLRCAGLRRELLRRRVRAYALRQAGYKHTWGFSCGDRAKDAVREVAPVCLVTPLTYPMDTKYRSMSYRSGSASWSLPRSCLITSWLCSSMDQISELPSSSPQLCALRCRSRHIARGLRGASSDESHQKCCGCTPRNLVRGLLERIDHEKAFSESFRAALARSWMSRPASSHTLSVSPLRPL